jgi:two-component system chemotaxis response regulator CheY
MKKMAVQQLHDYRILIVEDQPEMRILIKDMLKDLGITQMFEAMDGKEAMVFLDDAIDLIDLIICDWNMPRVTGVDVLRQLRSTGTDIPFLMITGRGDKSSVTEAKFCGVTAYIRKPFSPIELEAKLRIIKHRSSQKTMA